MQPFTILTGAAAPMPLDNIDTDAITPAAAGKSTSVDLGAMLFNNARYHLDGSENADFVLNKPKFRQARILVAGQNFGCDSSRERAVWALMKFGITCVIAPSFADIFHDNAYQNGLLPLIQPEEDCRKLAELLQHVDDPTMTVDLEAQQLTWPNGREQGFQISAERRMALLEGLDEISVILRMAPDIDAFEAQDRRRRPWVYQRRAV